MTKLKAQRSYAHRSPRSESFACELENFACETFSFRMSSANPSSRIGPKARVGGVLNQRLSLKGLHYREAGWARAAAVILGGGCDGKVSLSWLIRSCSSGSGWV